jgi:hypothetical protein
MSCLYNDNHYLSTLSSLSCYTNFAMVKFGRIFQRITSVCFILIFFQILPWISPVAAQLQYNIAKTLAIDDKNAVDGDIMSLSTKPETLVRSTVLSDSRMYGVLEAKPVIVYRTLPTLAVARDGDVMVNVTTHGGAIVVGDYITSSPIAGKGEKGQGVTGYMLGIALDNFDGKNVKQSADYQGKKYPMGRIKVTIGIGPASPVITKASGGIMGTLKQLATAIMFNISTSQQAERIIRYILAVIVAVVIIYVSYRAFGKNVTQGLESIGRNPLAKGTIQAMITLNIILLAISCIAGVALALVIISL